MKTKLLTVAAVMVLGACGLAWGQSVVLDPVEGTFIPADSMIDGFGPALMWDSTYTLPIRFQAEGQAWRGVTNGFRISSPGSATWGTTVIDTTGTLGRAEFDLVWALQPAGWDTLVTGSGADTVGIGGSVMFNAGMPADFDDVVVTITIGPIDQAGAGDSICIDSSYYPPSGPWQWALPTTVPSWSGKTCWRVFDPTMDVTTRPADGLPTEWMMSQNYPNPFNPTTEIAFDVPSRSHVTLNVYNVLGQQVATLVDQELARGSYTADWDGTSTSGTAAASGVYFYRLEADRYIDTKKMVLMK